jgi:tRNA threonylcarbamoyladenosine biosynthesis protein TsaB
VLINNFLISNDLAIKDILRVYVNRGPGSFAGIRNSLSIAKGIYVAKKIDYYCFSFDDFDESDRGKYENVPSLCDKFKVKKNLINPIYLS